MINICELTKLDLVDNNNNHFRHHTRHDYPHHVRGGSIPGADPLMTSHPQAYYGSHHPDGHDYRGAVPGLGSPERLPLDERLEKELGIKVCDKSV